MKQLIASLALAAATALVPTLAHAGLDSDNPIHPLLGIALTAGGDKIASATYTDGYTKDISAGGLVYLYGGVEFHPKDSRFGFQATIGYHVDNTTARNGDQRFQRWPIEAIALFNVAPKFRVGVGARYAASAKFTSDGDAYQGNGDFSSQIGAVVLGEWLITPSMGVQLRYVNEKYKAWVYTPEDDQVHRHTYDGSHGGIGFNYYF